MDSSAHPLDVEVSSRLLESRQEIIETWAARLRKDLPEARNLPAPLLRDDLPNWLDRLIAALATPDAPLKLAKVSKYARKHGRVRTTTPFDLNEVLYEYELLRQVLFDILERSQPVPSRQRNIILDAIQLSARAAASEFVKLMGETNSRPFSRARGTALPVRLAFSWGIVVLTIVIQRLLWPLIEPMGYFLFYPAIALASLWADGPSAIILLVLASEFFFTGSHHLLPQTWQNGVRDLVFVAGGTVVWGISHSLRVSQERAQQALAEQGLARRDAEESQSELAAILESVPGGLVIGDMTGFERSNRKALELLGYDRPEELRRSVRAIMSEVELRGSSTGKPMSVDDLAFTRALATQEPASAEILVKNRKTREDHILRSDAAPVIVDGKAIAAVSIHTDITLLRRSEELERLARKEAEKALEDLQNERDLRIQFVSTLTHDLRSPLTAAKAAAQLIQRRFDLPEGAPELVTRVALSLERADRMIQDLLDANRIRAGQGLPVQLVDCDLEDVIREAVEEATTIHGDRFQYSAHSVKGNWSRKYLIRMIQNLLENAVKYGDPAEAVNVSAINADGHVLIAVHNSGKPIPAEHLTHLFQPFRRAPDTRNVLGWGLGLTLVMGVVEAHHGTIDVESNRESGTTFRIRLPKNLPIQIKPPVQ